MNIFSYRFPDRALSAEGIDALKEATKNRTLVLFQNMPETLVEVFSGETYSGGTYTETGDGVGMYAVSTCDETITVTAEDLATSTHTQKIEIFYKNIWHIDYDVNSNEYDIERSMSWMTEGYAPENFVAIVGSVNYATSLLTHWADTLTELNLTNQQTNKNLLDHAKSHTIGTYILTKPTYEVSSLVEHYQFGEAGVTSDMMAVDFMLDASV